MSLVELMRTFVIWLRLSLVIFVITLPAFASDNPTEPIVYGFDSDTLILIVTIFLAGLLSIMAYGKWITMSLTFHNNRRQTFIDSLMENTKEGIWIANKDREIEQVNSAFTDITGITAQEALNKCFKIMKESGRNYEVENLIWQEVVKSGFWHGEIWSIRDDGQRVSFDMSVTRVSTESRLSKQIDVKYVGMMSDVTDRKQNEQAMHQLATRDQLTTLLTGPCLSSTSNIQ